MKRSLCSVTKIGKKPCVGHWSQGLLAAMNDPASKVQEDDDIVVIKDKFPKSRVHYLVLSRSDLSGIRSLTSEHIHLVQHMVDVGHQLVQSHDDKHQFRMGFHAVPSMPRLHMHVISQDFISDCLKTKKHWNSFTTEFFLDAKDVVDRLRQSGVVSQLPTDEVDRLLAAPLQCHKCQQRPSNMPKLKLHLISHTHTASEQHAQTEAAPHFTHTSNCSWR